MLFDCQLKLIYKELKKRKRKQGKAFSRNKYARAFQRKFISPDVKASDKKRKKKIKKLGWNL